MPGFPYTFPIIWWQDNSRACTLAAAIDWDGDGDFTDTGDDVTARVRNQPAVGCVRGRDQIRALAPPMAGSGSFTLDNRSRDYSPENSGSPLDGKIMPGRPARLQIVVDGTARDVFRGVLDDLALNSHISQRSVDISLLGNLSRLRGKAVSTPLYENILTSTALSYLLDAVDWPAAERVIASGDTTLLYWWCDEDDAYDMAIRLLNTEGPGAALYEDAQGRIVFENRTYRLLTPRCAVSQERFSDQSDEHPQYYAFRYSPRLRDIINICTVSTNVRALGALATVWQYGYEITLGAAETRTFQARASAPFKAAVTPASGTDFTVASGSVAAVSLDRTSGASCTISITAGAGGATITGLQLRACPLAVASSTLSTNLTDTSVSQAAYGPQPYQQSIWPEINIEVAQSFCDAIVQAYQAPRPSVEIDILNVTAGELDAQLTRQISDRVTVEERESGLNATFFIERISHSFELPSILRTTLGMEKAPAAASEAIWDAAIWDLSTWGH